MNIYNLSVSKVWGIVRMQMKWRQGCYLIVQFSHKSPNLVNLVKILCKVKGTGCNANSHCYTSCGFCLIQNIVLPVTSISVGRI